MYDEHDDGWGSGSYWKRSLNAGTESSDLASAPSHLSVNYDRIGNALPPSINFNPSNYRTYDEHMNVYNGGGGSSISSSSSGIPQSQLPTYADAQGIVYSKQIPAQTYSLNWNVVIDTNATPKNSCNTLIIEQEIHEKNAHLFIERDIYC